MILELDQLSSRKVLAAATICNAMLEWTGNEAVHILH